MDAPPPPRRSGETALTRAWATGITGTADQLRRGAWYPVVEESSDGYVVLEVDTERVRVKRAEVKIRGDRPNTWSIVVRTGVMRPTLAGPRLVNTYAVCPDCTGRQEFDGHPETLMCVRCRRAAKVDWDTTY